MFNINDMASLRAAYSFVRTLRDVTVPVENVARRDKHIADVKREIREFTHRAASRSHIVRRWHRRLRGAGSVAGSSG